MKRFLTAATFVAMAAVTATCAPPATGYAGTTTWGAPIAHTAGSYPRIIVDVRVGSGWRVQEAVSTWNVPVTYGSCVSGVTCVRFTEVSSLGGNRVGLTTVPVSTGPTVINIQLADYPKMTVLQARQDVAHEFGHALGLGHDDIGVMQAAITGAYLGPVPAELARVRSLYLG
ncbi:MAG: hypothetical protein JWN96_394 [Mycobacterium sp.]|nr:hypothetical protein [Mycobacterium sp.]